MILWTYVFGVGGRYVFCRTSCRCARYRERGSLLCAVFICPTNPGIASMASASLKMRSRYSSIVACNSFTSFLSAANCSAVGPTACCKFVDMGVFFFGGFRQFRTVSGSCQLAQLARIAWFVPKDEQSAVTCFYRWQDTCHLVALARKFMRKNCSICHI